MQKKTLNISTGSLFALPFMSGGYGVVLVTRVWKEPRSRIGMVYTYGFPQHYQQIPTIKDVSHFSANDCITFTYASDMQMRNRTYPMIGHLQDYSDQLWPIPPEATIPGYQFDNHKSETITILLRADYSDNEHLISLTTNSIVLDDYKRLPNRKGFGDAAWIQVCLENAVMNQHPWQYVAASIDRFELWSRVMRTILTHKPELRQAATIWSKILNL